MFCNYLSYRQSSVRFLDNLNLQSEFLSLVPRASVLGHLLFNILDTELCIVMKHSKYLLFAGDIKNFLAVNSVDNCIFCCLILNVYNFGVLITHKDIRNNFANPFNFYITL